MKVLEPIHLHLLHLFTCRSQTFLSVQSPTEDGESILLASQFSRHWSSPTLSLLNDWHSQQAFQAVLEDEGKSLGPSLSSSDTLLWCLRTYFTDDTAKNNMAADDEFGDLLKRVTLAELAPGRLNEISQFKSILNGYFEGLNLNELRGLNQP